MGSARQLEWRGATESESVSEDELFDVLSNRRRRFAIHMLKYGSEPLKLGDMAEQIAAWENGSDIGEVTNTERKRVYTALQQSHLPKMDDAGVVDFRKDRGVVTSTNALEEVDLYLDVVRGGEIPWSEYYLGLSVFFAGLVAAVAVNAWPLTLFPDVAWSAFVVVTFGVSAAAHHYYAAEQKVGNRETPPELSR